MSTLWNYVQWDVEKFSRWSSSQYPNKWPNSRLVELLGRIENFSPTPSKSITKMGKIKMYFSWYVNCGATSVCDLHTECTYFNVLKILNSTRFPDFFYLNLTMRRKCGQIISQIGHNIFIPHSRKRFLVICISFLFMSFSLLFLKCRSHISVELCM